MKKGVILVNMGGAESPKQLRSFLYRMFTDKYIISAPLVIRYILAYFISRRRYKKSWKKYEKIGGTPILKAGKKMAGELHQLMNIPVEMGYSYSSPFIDEAVENLKSQSVESITVIPLYPQSSFTTTSSVLNDVSKLEKKHPNLNFTSIKAFYQRPEFISYWVELIQQHISDKKLQNPSLVFAAHSIPLSVIKKGDTYTNAIQDNAKLIAQKMELEYRISFQSKFGPIKWYGQDSKEVILALIKAGKKDIVLVPISFISECLETIYDIDIELFPELKKEIPEDIKLSRITIPYAHPLLIKTFKNII